MNYSKDRVIRGLCTSGHVSVSSGLYAPEWSLRKSICKLTQACWGNNVFSASRTLHVLYMGKKLYILNAIIIIIMFTIDDSRWNTLCNLFFIVITLLISAIMLSFHICNVPPLCVFLYFNNSHLLGCLYETIHVFVYKYHGFWDAHGSYHSSKF